MRPLLYAWNGPLPSDIEGASSAVYVENCERINEDERSSLEISVTRIWMNKKDDDKVKQYSSRKYLNLSLSSLLSHAVNVWQSDNYEDIGITGVLKSDYDVHNDDDDNS